MGFLLSSWSGKRPQSNEDGEDSEKWTIERAFDIADSVEKGFAREVVLDFMHPLRRSSRLWHFNVMRSQDKLQYRLYSAEGEFLMYARASIESQKVEFFLYNPCDNGLTLFDASRPAFIMTYNKERTEWRVMTERCENCQFLPRHLSCASRGKQEVVCMRHGRKAIGDGIMNVMDLYIPGIYSDGSRVVWCPLLEHGDLASPCEDSYKAHRLITKTPEWNEGAASLVLNFKNRDILSSAKNFQLALVQKPDHIICQYGKVGPATFSLDVKYPLSVIQAFAACLSTLFWT